MNNQNPQDVFPSTPRVSQDDIKPHMTSSHFDKNLIKNQNNVGIYCVIIYRVS